MDNRNTCHWLGFSGVSYTYHVYAIDDPIEQHAPATYIFTRRGLDRTWEALYVGGTDKAQDRLSGQREEQCARSYGATHVHVRPKSHSHESRLSEEIDLIRNHRPPCNEHHDRN
jgi:hypothetical protein